MSFSLSLPLPASPLVLASSSVLNWTLLALAGGLGGVVVLGPRVLPFIRACSLSASLLRFSSWLW